MKGHVRERGPGTWAIVIDRYDDAGKRHRKWHTFKTKSVRGGRREAEDECARLITEMKSGNYIEPTKQTAVEFFDEWLAHVRPSVAPKTHERYPPKHFRPAMTLD